MSNEVNQAFLRAYVKNRADRALQGTTQPQSANAPQPAPTPATRRDMPTRGGAIRIDQVSAPTEVHPTTISTPQTRSVPAPHLNPSTNKQRAPELQRPNANAIQEQQSGGVWSPIGVERGMKGTNRTTSAPAVIVNAPKLDSVPNIARVGSRTLASHATTPRSQRETPSSTQIQNINVEKKASHAASPKIRIDAGHGVQKKPHSSEMVIAPGFTTPVQVAPSVVVHDHLHGLRDQIHTSVMMPNAPIMAGAGLASPRIDTVPSAKVATTTNSSDIVTEPPKVPSDRTGESRAYEKKPMPRPGEIHSGMPTPPAPKLGGGTSNRPPIERKIDRGPLDRHAPTSNLPLPVAFSPSWEVDRFLWPDVLLQIQHSDPIAFQAIAKHLRLANQDGLKVIAVTSGERGVGRSTIAMHLARCASSSGLRVALVDADGFYPSLIDQLKLDLEHGWQECLFENIPLEEVAVKSIEDDVTFFPLTSIIPTQQLHANLHRTAKIVKRISLAYDMVFLDSNRLNLEQRDLIGVSQESVVDAAIVVTDSELSIKEKVDTAVSILHGMGIASVGIVQNFHS